MANKCSFLIRLFSPHIVYVCVCVGGECVSYSECLLYERSSWCLQLLWTHLSLQNFWEKHTAQKYYLPSCISDIASYIHLQDTHMLKHKDLTLFVKKCMYVCVCRNWSHANRAWRLAASWNSIQQLPPSNLSCSLHMTPIRLFCLKHRF